MSIKRMLLIILLLVALISVGINAVILGSLTDRFFSNYLNEVYDSHIEQIMDYALKVLKEKTITKEQLKADMETHLVDPIFRIRLFDSEGKLLEDVSSDMHMRGMMMDGRLARMRSNGDEVTDQFILEDDGGTWGSIYITRYSAADNSLVARLFKMSLLSNSLRAVMIAMAISASIALLISRLMSKDLKETAILASDIQSGKQVKFERSIVSEITSIRSSLHDLSTKLRLKQKGRKELTDKLIHETRTPLTIIKTHLEGIEDGVIAADQVEIELLKNQVEIITSLIKGLSGMIEADALQNEMSIEEFELNKLLKQILSGLSTQFSNKGLKIILDSEDKVIMRTDKFKLSQVFYNLLNNAWKYTDAGGHVTISYNRSGDFININIADNGSGIDNDDLKHIFDAYYRGKDQAGSGDGIGLYIVKGNMTLLGGDVTVSSAVGDGTEFVLSLPVTYNNGEAEEV
ncbi:HAMP domain-containing sensor histidine kinase [Gudongella oleilytica]|uniref:sensor histidine kinase n=1 Tax=Gudongella oleilytica TaxID=1582259 RepID=UPI002A35879B|nr:HAMP domain-containing sensor histidine kinase [Gudongella oleilytica]MDY0257160.1 HAMP domain-containing sensor histidine kinase [Gudongella oleilytica]